MNWWQRLLRPDRMERELDAELRFHFESQVDEKMQSGMSEGEARRAARLEFGLSAYRSAQLNAGITIDAIVSGG